MSIKNILVVFGIMTILVSCNKETLKDQITASPEKISWEDFYKYCSSGNLYREDNFKKIKDAQLMWTGTVVEIKDDPSLDDLGRTGEFLEKIITVKMKPNDALFADVELRMKKELGDDIKIFKKGDPVQFKGQIKFLGSTMSPNIVNIEAIHRAKIEKEEKTKRKNPFK